MRKEGISIFNQDDNNKDDNLDLDFENNTKTDLLAAVAKANRIALVSSKQHNKEMIDPSSSLVEIAGKPATKPPAFVLIK